jgi:hypothetical protein
MGRRGTGLQVLNKIERRTDFLSFDVRSWMFEVRRSFSGEILLLPRQRLSGPSTIQLMLSIFLALWIGCLAGCRLREFRASRLSIQLARRRRQCGKHGEIIVFHLRDSAIDQKVSLLTASHIDSQRPNTEFHKQWRSIRQDADQSIVSRDNGLINGLIRRLSFRRNNRAVKSHRWGSLGHSWESVNWDLVIRISRISLFAKPLPEDMIH